MNRILKNHGEATIHVCPNGCDSLLSTPAHVMQDWAVDAEGEFQSCVNACVETTHGPNNDNIWTCMSCDAEADMVSCQKYSLEKEHASVYVPLKDKTVVYALWDGHNTPQKCSVINGLAYIGGGINIIVNEDGSIEAKDSIFTQSAVTYTAHRYGKTTQEILDMTMFEDAADAIKYATQNNCDEVVNDESGEVIYKKLVPQDKFVLSCCADDGSIIYSMPFDGKESALRAGIYSIIHGQKVSLHIRENTGSRPQMQPARFIPLKKIQRLLDESDNNVEEVIATLMEEPYVYN